MLLTPSDLPEDVWWVSMWWKWASAVRHGRKLIETREWEWKHGPSWVVIHASKQADGPIPGRIEPFPPVPDVVPGALCCLIYINGCRPLLEFDKPHALVYRPGLFAFVIGRVIPLKPIAMVGPRRLARLPRSTVIEALET